MSAIGGEARRAAPCMALQRIIFWEPCVSPHKSAFVGAVAREFGASVDVQYVAHEELPDERRALGWDSGASDSYRTIVAPDAATIATLVANGGSRCLHVFSGIRWFATLTCALAQVRRLCAPFAIMSEPRDGAGIKGALRFGQSWLTEGWLRSEAAFVLAIGQHGPPWFRSVGYPAERVFPFAYFLAAPDANGSGAAQLTLARPSRTGTAPLEIAYVGRLIETKGVRYLLPAMRRLTPRARLTLIGDGPLRGELEDSAHRLGIEAHFSGVLPIAEVQQRMRVFDALVLPSCTKDGWGAVVSEALLAGTAVITSTCVGASILFGTPCNGRVVAPRDSEAIASALIDLQHADALTIAARAARMRWASARLSAQAGASYFARIVRHRTEGCPRPPEFYL